MKHQITVATIKIIVKVFTGRTLPTDGGDYSKYVPSQKLRHYNNKYIFTVEERASLETHLPWRVQHPQHEVLKTKYLK